MGNWTSLVGTFAVHVVWFRLFENQTILHELHCQFGEFFLHCRRRNKLVLAVGPFNPVHDLHWNVCSVCEKIEQTYEWRGKNPAMAAWNLQWIMTGSPRSSTLLLVWVIAWCDLFISAGINHCSFPSKNEMMWAGIFRVASRDGKHWKDASSFHWMRYLRPSESYRTPTMKEQCYESKLVSLLDRATSSLELDSVILPRTWSSRALSNVRRSWSQDIDRSVTQRLCSGPYPSHFNRYLIYQ